MTKNHPLEKPPGVTVQAKSLEAGTVGHFGSGLGFKLESLQVVERSPETGEGGRDARPGPVKDGLFFPILGQSWFREAGI